MAKYLIPSLLVITVLVAGIYALVPVEQASAVHTTIAANISSQDRIISYSFSTGTTALTDGNDANILPFKSGAWTGSANIIVTDGSGICRVFEVADATTETSGTSVAGATQTGPGSSQFDAFPASTDRVHVAVAANMDCTVVVFLDQTIE
ncbi:MAG: hypothetical protein IIA83_00190 [Thaumarchaeota archaeon]|nr:hypothetical protein [Nitrososphaerota archaeon]